MRRICEMFECSGEMTDFSLVVTVPVDELDEKSFLSVVITDLILNKTSSGITRKQVMDNPRFFSTQSLNTSIAFLVPLFSFKVPVSGATGNSMSEMENIIQQIFVVFGFILLFSFGLIPLLVGIGQPTIGR